MTTFACILIGLAMIVPGSAQKPIKRLPLLIEYSHAPDDWRSFATDSDVVAVVQLSARDYRVIDKPGRGRNPATHFYAHVMDVIKAPPGVSTGGTIDIFRMGGLMDTSEGLVAFEDPAFPPWRPKMTLLVFLKWSEYHGGYVPMHGPAGAYELDPVSGNVRTFGQGRTAKAQKGRAFEVLLAEVRARIR